MRNGPIGNEDGSSNALSMAGMTILLLLVLMLIFSMAGAAVNTAAQTASLEFSWGGASRACSLPEVSLTQAQLTSARAVMESLRLVTAAEASEIVIKVTNDHALKRHGISALTAYTAINLVCRPLSVFMCVGQNGRSLDLMGVCRGDDNNYIVVFFTPKCDDSKKILLADAVQALAVQLGQMPREQLLTYEYCALTMFKTDAANVMRMVRKGNCRPLGTFTLLLRP